MIWTALSNCALLTMIVSRISDADYHDRNAVYIGRAVQESRGQESHSGSAMPAMEKLKWALTRD
jgi:hypothetical protein